MLFWLELIVVDKLNHPIFVNDISLSSRQWSKEITWHSPFLSHLVALITQQCEWKFVFAGKCLHYVKRKSEKKNINMVDYKNQTVEPLIFTLCEEASSPLIPTTTAPAFLNFSYESLKAQACNKEWITPSNYKTFDKRSSWSFLWDLLELLCNFRFDFFVCYF